MKGAKGIAVMLLRKSKGGGGEDETEHEDGADLEMPSLREVSQELIDAVMNHDTAGVAKALRAAHACISDEPDEDDAEE